MARSPLLRSALRASAALVLSLAAACGERVTEQYHGIETSYGAITVPKLDQGYNLEFFGTDTHLIPLGAQNFPAAGTVGEGDNAKPAPSADRIDNAITRDSLVIAGDVAITWRYNPATIVQVFKELRGKGDDLESAALFRVSNSLRDGFRSAVATQSIGDLLGPSREAFPQVVKEKVQAKLGQYFIVDQVFIRGIYLPKAIADARERIISQTAELQQAKNQQTIAEAQAASKIAEARGEAEATKLRAESYSTNRQLLDLEIAREQAKVCQGVTTCVIGGSTADLLFRARGQ